MVSVRHGQCPHYFKSFSWLHRRHRSKVSMPSCGVRIQSFKGTMCAKKHVELPLGWDRDHLVPTKAVISEKHVSGFPHVLVGRRALFADLGGIQMHWDDARHVLTVRFLKWPGIEGIC